MKEFCRFLKFIFFSVMAAVIEYLIMKFVLQFVIMSDIFEKIVSLLVYVYFDYKLNKVFTFESGANNYKSYLKILLFYLVFSIISNCVFRYNNTMFIVTFVSIINLLFEFYYQKYYVYKNNIDDNPVKIKM